MKKLMIVAAVAVAALASNAASFNWSNTGGASNGVIYDYQANSTKLYSATVAYTAYLICAGDTTQADLLTAIRKGDALSDYGIAGASATLNSSSKIAATDAFDYGTTGNDYDFYFAILDDANDQILISALSEGNAAQLSATTTVAFTDSKTWSNQAFGDATYSAAGWYSTAAVPEPTSGILLLLGFAGLVLKRKRA
ncbi:MAG: PEP-CTERM sorting domain-containing protein [Kiritimatiellae bacterium]|nr:PEP-CTERM sorting domain-containing protein [Kiritimatiellia bacterium]